LRATLELSAIESASDWDAISSQDADEISPNTSPICLARKPLSEKSIAANVLKWGTGALNIDGCRIEGESTIRPDNSRMTSAGKTGGAYGSGGYPAGEPRTNGSTLGRWPANLCHDGSDEVVAGFPDSVSTGGDGYKNSMFCGGKPTGGHGLGDSGSAARFFYCAKASSDERGDGNNHPTVKPVALMRWLVRLVTPKGGTVLDPFMGSGSTGLACQAEQFSFIGCEMSPEYAAIAERRMRDAAGLFADITVAA
jgi:site-specific DNA-methyltransferase (adenine-specific)